MNPDQRRVLLETADELDQVYEKHAHEIRMLGLNDLYDALTELRKYAERLRKGGWRGRRAAAWGLTAELSAGRRSMR
ncbi:MAG: hypothetical protein ACRDNP_01555 [Gaiellaceae bacterium]